MSETVQIAGPRPLVVVTRILLWVFIAAAVVAAAFSLIDGINGLAQTLSSGLTKVVLVADKGSALFNLNNASAATRIVHGQFSTATLVVSGLPAGIVAIVVVSAIANVLTQVTLCAMVALLAWRLLRRRPFRRSLSVTVSISGLVLAVGGVLGQGTTAIAGGATAAQLNGGGNGYWPLAGRFDPTVPVVGLILILVALAFEYGERLQKDTEGLV